MPAACRGRKDMYVRAVGPILVAFAAVVVMVAVGLDIGAGSAAPDDPAPVTAVTLPGAISPPANAGSSGPAAAIPSAQAFALAQLRLSIERVGISLPLAAGDLGRDVIAGATPEGVALLFPGTPVPGTPGNSFIYAHARSGMFLGLWNVRIGDRVEVLAADGTRLRYVITQIAPRVDPSDGSWLDQSGPERLTLQTSTGPTSGYPRFIAVAARLLQAGD